MDHNCAHAFAGVNPAAQLSKSWLVTISRLDLGLPHNVGLDDPHKRLIVVSDW